MKSGLKDNEVVLAQVQILHPFGDLPDPVVLKHGDISEPLLSGRVLRLGEETAEGAQIIEICDVHHRRVEGPGFHSHFETTYDVVQSASVVREIPTVLTDHRFLTRRVQVTARVISLED